MKAGYKTNIFRKVTPIHFGKIIVSQLGYIRKFAQIKENFSCKIIIRQVDHALYVLQLRNFFRDFTSDRSTKNKQPLERVTDFADFFWNRPGKSFAYDCQIFQRTVEDFLRDSPRSAFIAVDAQ